MALLARIQHYLGHRSIASTVRYTALAPDRFKGFGRIEPEMVGAGIGVTLLPLPV